MKWGAAGLAALTLIRLWVASAAPLAPDEAYYWTWSRALAAGYLDHPPMVALWIRAGTSLVGANALGVRLLGPLSAALGSWMLYDAAERLFPGRRAGLTSAVLLNATLIVGVGGVVLTPDTPLLLFWTATLWAGARLATGGPPVWWLAAGVFTGLALVSKYTAAFLPIGLGLYAIISAPRSLRRVEPWLGGLIAGLVFLPVMVWNAQHGWAGFLRQGGRVSDWRPERAVGFVAELVGGQIGLATPGIFILFTAGIAMAIRLTARTRRPEWTLLAALSVPPTLMFLQHATGDRVQGNWPAVLYPAASIAAAGLSAPGWRHWIWPSSGVGFAMAAALYAYVIAEWPPLPGVRDPVANQLFGWNTLARRVGVAGTKAGATFIAAEPYGVAAELAWALPSDVDVVGTGSHWERTSLPRMHSGPGLGLLIRPERYGPPDPVEWSGAVPMSVIARTSSGLDIDRYAVFLVWNANDRVPGVILPRR